jgi:hypothetical protein
MADSSPDIPFYSSLVTEHIVPKGKDFAFKSWHTTFTAMAQRHPGFLRADLCPPLRCKDEVVKWYSIIHFDSPNHLEQWMKSSDRQHHLELSHRILQSYRFKSFTTGLEGWFSQRSGTERWGLGPPAWKQILSVVLGLYPIVMLQSALFNKLGLMASWSPALTMLINNLVTSTLLTLVVMPRIAKWMQFWLKPPYHQSSWKVDGLGAAIAIGLFGLMVIGFDLLLK